MNYELGYTEFSNQQPNALDFVEWNYRQVVRAIANDLPLVAGLYAREGAVWAKLIQSGQF